MMKFLITLLLLPFLNPVHAQSSFISVQVTPIPEISAGIGWGWVQGVKLDRVLSGAWEGSDTLQLHVAVGDSVLFRMTEAPGPWIMVMEPQVNPQPYCPQIHGLYDPRAGTWRLRVLTLPTQETWSDL